MQTELRNLLGIKSPVIQAGVPWVSNAELAATVSNAGGLGVVTADAGAAPGESRAANCLKLIHRAKVLTSLPFGVTVYLPGDEAKDIIRHVLDERVRVVVTAGAGSALYTGELKDRGITVMHIVASVRHAIAAEAAGVDAIIASGVETGGLVGVEETPMSVLVPQIVEAVDVPVVASGGIATGGGLAAALAMGAQGACVGTRLIATHECIAHPAYKGAILSAVDSTTLVLGRGASPMRALKTPYTLRLQREARAAGEGGKALWDAALAPERIRAAALEGDLESGIPLAGASAGLISEVMGAAEVVSTMVAGSDRVLRALSGSRVTR